METTKKGRYTRSFVIKEEIWLEFKKIFFKKNF